MATLALWLNTVGFRFQPSAAAYALALTWLLVVGGWVFVGNGHILTFIGDTCSLGGHVGGNLAS